jgi:ferritin
MYKCAYIGYMFSSEEIVYTKRGRLTSPFPKIKSKITKRYLKKIDQWLVDEAKKEVVLFGNNLEKVNILNININNLSQADKNMCEMFLFEECVNT